MFDLFRSREKAVRYLLGALLMMVAISMVVTLIPGYGSSSSRSDDTTVAEIGKEVVTTRDVQRTLQDAMHKKDFPPEMVQLYLPQLVDQMITQRAMAYQASRMGFEVTDAELARTLQSMLQRISANGQVDMKAYDAFLAEQGLTRQQFESNVKKQMLLLRLQNLALEGVVVTPQEVAQEYSRRNEKIKLEYIAFSPDKFHSQIQVSPQELKDYFVKYRGLFQILEKRSAELLLVEEAKVAATIDVPDEKLRQTYDANKNRFRNPERVKARHILLMTKDKKPEEIAKIKGKAEELLKKIKGGADFAELAKQNSEDPSSAVKGGDVGWVVRGQMVKNFENTTFSLKPKEISDVISTEYGFHIIQVMEKEDARLKPFEEAKVELVADAKKTGVFDKMQSLADQARAALVKNPTGAQQVAEQLNLKYVKVDKIAQGDPIPEVGVSPDFSAALSSLKKGEVTQPIQLPANKLAVGIVTEVFPLHPAEMSEVESQVRDRYVSEKSQQLVKDKAREAAEKLKSNGGDLKKVAQSMGLQVKNAPEFTRDAAAEGIGPASYMLDSFIKPVGTVVGPFAISDSEYIVKTTEKIPADAAKLAAARADIAETLKKKKATEQDELFQDSILTQLVKERKVKIHRDVIKRMVGAYKS